MRLGSSLAANFAGLTGINLDVLGIEISPLTWEFTEILAQSTARENFGDFAHNPEVAGSNPAPATNFRLGDRGSPSLKAFEI